MMPKFVEHPMLGSRFDDALGYANSIHRYHVRKGGLDQPYISHLLGVCAIVLDSGGDEDQAIAALLHDAVEDLKIPYEEIEHRFGAEVTAIVRGCTDDVNGKRDSTTWDDRKAAHLAHLENETNVGVLIVVAADKLYNCRCIVRDLRKSDEAFWTRFNAGEAQTFGYYTERLVRTFENVRRNHPNHPVLGPILDDFMATVAELQRFR
jgi:GTP pyrophosphokinase